MVSTKMPLHASFIIVSPYINLVRCTVHVQYVTISCRTIILYSVCADGVGRMVEENMQLSDNNNLHCILSIHVMVKNSAIDLLINTMYMYDICCVLSTL